MIRLRIPDDVAPGSAKREGSVLEFIAMPGQHLERVGWALVRLDNGLLLRVRFDDCELLAY